MAEAQKAEFVVDHPKLSGLSDPTAEASQRIVRDRAARQFLHPSAALADQVGVMPGELFSQLVPKAAAGRIHGPQET